MGGDDDATDQAAGRPTVPVKPTGFDGPRRSGLTVIETNPTPVLGFMMTLPPFTASGVCGPGMPAPQHGVVIEIPVHAFAVNIDPDSDYTRVPVDLPVEWFDESCGEHIEPAAGRKSVKALIEATVAEAIKKARS